MSAPLEIHSPAGTISKRTCAITTKSPSRSEAARTTPNSSKAAFSKHLGGGAPSVSAGIALTGAISATTVRKTSSWLSLRSVKGDFQLSDLAICEDGAETRQKLTLWDTTPFLAQSVLQLCDSTGNTTLSSRREGGDYQANHIMHWLLHVLMIPRQISLGYDRLHLYEAVQ